MHQALSIPCGKQTLAANLFKPESLSEQENVELVLFLGPLTSVKEQVAGNYAKAFAQHGYWAIAIDNMYFGESSGEPRQYENPRQKVDDIKHCIDYMLEKYSQIKSVFAVGICAGAGYMAKLVEEMPELKGFGTVAGFMHSQPMQKQWMGENYQTAIEKGIAARKKYEQTGEAEYIPAVGKDGEDVAMPLAEAYAYYGTERGAVPNYTNRFALMSKEHTTPWDSQAAAPKIKVPTIMIHSDNALAPALAKSFYEKLGPEKELLWTESKGQIDFYDEREKIQFAVDGIAKFFSKH